MSDDIPNDPAGTAGPLLDPAAVVRLREWGGDDLVGQMIELFLKNGPARLDEMLQGLDGGDLDRVERGAHSLKSSAGNLGAETLRGLCARMEDAGEHGRGEEALRLRDELEATFRRTVEALERLRTEGAE